MKKTILFAFVAALMSVSCLNTSKWETKEGDRLDVVTIVDGSYNTPYYVEFDNGETASVSSNRVGSSITFPSEPAIMRGEVRKIVEYYEDGTPLEGFDKSIAITNILNIPTDVIKLLDDINAVEYDAPMNIVAAGYADAHRVGAVGPMEIPKVAKDAGCDLAMLDTAVKDGHTLFDYLDIDQLQEFVDEAHSYGLLTALAGSVKKEQLKPLHDIGCDVVGIRGAACVGGDRNTGKIHHTAVAELKELCDSF